MGRISDVDAATEEKGVVLGPLKDFIPAGSLSKAYNRFRNMRSVAATTGVHGHNTAPTEPAVTGLWGSALPAPGSDPDKNTVVLIHGDVAETGYAESEDVTEELTMLANSLPDWDGKIVRSSLFKTMAMRDERKRRNNSTLAFTEAEKEIMSQRKLQMVIRHIVLDHDSDVTVCSKEYKEAFHHAGAHCENLRNVYGV
jgi:hypothetical protein